MRDAFDSIPDSAVTLPRPVPVPLATPPTPVQEAPQGFAHPTLRARPALHARPFELSAVATLSVALTLVVTLFVSRVLHSGGSRTALGEAARTPAVTSEPVTPAAPVRGPVTELGPRSAIPVVPLSDLPLEHAGWPSNLTSSSASSRAPTSGSADRAELARALEHAARAASSCGPGPVNTQMLVTFAPSGVARYIHFAASPPPAAMQSCVLNAVARARVPAFEGPAISVSKTMHW